MTGFLSGKNVLITGVGASIGRHIALEMAAQGASIYFIDIDETCCAALQTELERKGVRAQGWTLDIAKASSIEKLRRVFSESQIRIDVLINNVGVEVAQLPERSDETPFSTFDAWRLIYKTNVIGPMALTDWVAQQMMNDGRGGCILFLSSIHQWCYKGDAAYSSSKAAVGSMIEELALKWAPHGIRVNGIAPGLVKLEENGLLRAHLPTPLHATAIHPQYIGRTAVYLASDYFSHFTTGTILKLTPVYRSSITSPCCRRQRRALVFTKSRVAHATNGETEKAKSDLKSAASQSLANRVLDSRKMALTETCLDLATAFNVVRRKNNDCAEHLRFRSQIDCPAAALANRAANRQSQTVAASRGRARCVRAKNGSNHFSVSIAPDETQSLQIVSVVC